MCCCEAEINTIIQILRREEDWVVHSCGGETWCRNEKPASPTKSFCYYNVQKIYSSKNAQNRNFSGKGLAAAAARSFSQYICEVISEEEQSDEHKNLFNKILSLGETKLISKIKEKEGIKGVFQIIRPGEDGENGYVMKVNTGTLVKKYKMYFRCQCTKTVTILILMFVSLKITSSSIGISPHSCSLQTRGMIKLMINSRRISFVIILELKNQSETHGVRDWSRFECDCRPTNYVEQFMQSTFSQISSALIDGIGL